MYAERFLFELVQWRVYLSLKWTVKRKIFRSERKIIIWYLCNGYTANRIILFFCLFFCLHFFFKPFRIFILPPTHLRLSLAINSKSWYGFSRVYDNGTSTFLHPYTLCRPYIHYRYENKVLVLASLSQKVNSNSSILWKRGEKNLFLVFTD